MICGFCGARVSEWSWKASPEGGGELVACDGCAAAPEVRVHCWEAGPDEPDGMTTTCMLADGHAGEHRWQRDELILVTFPEVHR